MSGLHTGSVIRLRGGLGNRGTRLNRLQLRGFAPAAGGPVDFF